MGEKLSLPLLTIAQQKNKIEEAIRTGIVVCHFDRMQATASSGETINLRKMENPDDSKSTDYMVSIGRTLFSNGSGTAFELIHPKLSNTYLAKLYQKAEGKCVWQPITLSRKRAKPVPKLILPEPPCDTSPYYSKRCAQRLVNAGVGELRNRVPDYNRLHHIREQLQTIFHSLCRTKAKYRYRATCKEIVTALRQFSFSLD